MAAMAVDDDRTGTAHSAHLRRRRLRTELYNGNVTEAVTRSEDGAGLYTLGPLLWPPIDMPTNSSDAPVRFPTSLLTLDQTAVHTYTTWMMIALLGWASDVMNKAVDSINLRDANGKLLDEVCLLQEWEKVLRASKPMLNALSRFGLVNTMLTYELLGWAWEMVKLLINVTFKSQSTCTFMPTGDKTGSVGKLTGGDTESMLVLIYVSLDKISCLVMMLTMLERFEKLPRRFLQCIEKNILARMDDDMGGDIDGVDHTAAHAHDPDSASSTTSTPAAAPAAAPTTATAQMGNFQSVILERRQLEELGRIIAHRVGSLKYLALPFVQSATVLRMLFFPLCAQVVLACMKSYKDVHWGDVSHE